MLSADWSHVTIAGAFIGGTIIGAAAVVRLTKHILDYLSKRRDD